MRLAKSRLTRSRSIRFNSRTREGCDKSPQALNLERSEFQFTHPGGVRHVDYSQYRIAGEFQFTHPGGVRHTTRSILPTSLSFNSRTREGCDCTYTIVSTSPRRFQFTHPGGVRPTNHLTQPNSNGSFNSRTREGCDLLVADKSNTFFRFNSRTREGCDPLPPMAEQRLNSFNSRTREGCD